MKRFLALFLIIGFILWILPLGYFIKPFQERLVCDGQRAMCMCHMVGHKSSSHAMEPGISLKAGSSHKENNSGNGGNYFVQVKPLVNFDLHSASIFENQFLSYKSPFLATLEYVPKI